MESTNFFREALASLKNVKLSVNDRVKLDTAVKFSLPENGLLLDNGLAALPETINLPFPEILVEYRCKDHYLEDAISYMVNAGFDYDRITTMNRLHMARDKVIVVASQPTPGSDIQITTLHHELTSKIWDISEELLFIPANRQAALRLLNADPFSPPSVADFTLESSRGELDDGAKIALWFTNKKPAMAVYALCEALGVTNVSQVTVPAKKRTFTEQRKKALPYSSYQTLVIDVSKPITLRTPTRSGIGHASPREHVRRGHWRTYRSGKRVWVEAMMVNPGTAGSIHKDYRLK